MKMKVSREQVDAWNRMAEAVRNTSNYYAFTLWHEYKTACGRWSGIGHSLVRQSRIIIEGEVFYIKKYKDNVYLYWEFCGDAERWLLSDLGRAYFYGEEKEV